MHNDDNMVRTAVSVLPVKGRSGRKSAVESKRYENDPSVIPPSLQQQQQRISARVLGNDKVTTALAVSTLPSPVQLVGKSARCVKSYECGSLHPEQQQQQLSRWQGSYDEYDEYDDNDDECFDYDCCKDEYMNQYSDCDEYNDDDKDDHYYDNSWMEYTVKANLELNEETDDEISDNKDDKSREIKHNKSREIGIKMNGQRRTHKERKSYADVYTYQYRQAVKARRAATRFTKVGHIDGYYKIFEEANSVLGTVVTKSRDSEQEQPMAQPPPQVQRQKRTTADQAAVCSSNKRQQVQARKRKEPVEAADKSMKKIREENGTDWVSQEENGQHARMNLMVQMPIWNSTRVWDAERTVREGGGKAATVTRFRFR
jgi:hypothetical protein